MQMQYIKHGRINSDIEFRDSDNKDRIGIIKEVKIERNEYSDMIIYNVLCDGTYIYVDGETFRQIGYLKF